MEVYCLHKGDQYLHILFLFLYNRHKLEEKAKLYEQMTKGDFPG